MGENKSVQSQSMIIKDDNHSKGDILLTYKVFYDLLYGQMFVGLVDPYVILSQTLSKTRISFFVCCSITIVKSHKVKSQSEVMACQWKELECWTCLG